jgi:hypothetical protein
MTKLRSEEFPPETLTKLPNAFLVALCRTNPEERKALELMLEHLKEEHPDADHSEWQISQVLNALKD